MEKYSAWRDAGTGLHPFLPNKSQKEYDNGAVKVLWWLKRLLIGTVLIVLRLPLIIIVVVWLMLFSFIAQLIPISIIRRFFDSYIQCFGARVLLFLMGFIWIETKYVHLSRQRKEGNLGKPGSLIKNGDIIIANHVSYVDVLYLAFRFAPTFTAVPTIWTEAPPSGVVIPRGLWGAFLDCISFPTYKIQDSKPFVPFLRETRSKMRGPVVLFPEGTTSNGKTLLNPVPALAISKETEILTRRSVHVVGFKYDYEDFSPAYTVGSFLWHFLRLISQVHNSLQVRYLGEADVPTLPLDGSTREPTESDIEEWVDALFRALAAILQIAQTYV